MAPLDLLAGVGLLATAVVLHRRGRLALLALAAGVLWFLGGVFEPLLFAHRAPLTHLLLIYPAVPRRRYGRLRAAVVAIIYAVSLIYPWGRSGAVAVAVWMLVLCCLWWTHYQGLTRSRSQRLAAWCAGVFWSVLAGGALLRWAGAADDGMLLTVYELTVVVITAAMITDEVLSRWRPALLAEFSVDLGELGPRSLSQAIGAAVGDPTVRLGLVDDRRLVDEQGLPIVLTADRARVVTPLTSDGRELGALEHDASVRLAPELLQPLAGMIETALGNARLQSLIAAQITQVEESRRRLILVVDTERSAFASRIDKTVASTLGQAASLIRTLEDPGDLIDRVDQAHQVLTDFCRGVHPVRLADEGLAAAIADLARAGTTPTSVEVQVGRLPSEIENLLYFVVAEAMTNITKHAGASQAQVSLRMDDHRVVLAVSDNGIGGASDRAGGGLAGLRDRLDTAGGTLEVTTPATGGTQVRAQIPCTPKGVTPRDFSQG